MIFPSVFGFSIHPFQFMLQRFTHLLVEVLLLEIYTTMTDFGINHFASIRHDNVSGICETYDYVIDYTLCCIVVMFLFKISPGIVDMRTYFSMLLNICL